MSELVWNVFDAVGICVLLLAIVTGTTMRGRISRRLIRALGLPGTVLLRLCVWIAAICLYYVPGERGASRLIWAAGVAWVADDLAYRDPPERRRGRNRVKLKMPKPVKLRPAERWSPA